MIPFNFSDETISYYVEGECAVLAVALAKRLKGLIVALTDVNDEIIHWLVQVNNVYVDIMGIYLDELTLLEEWRKWAKNLWDTDVNYNLIDVDQITLNDIYMAESVECQDEPPENLMNDIINQVNVYTQ